MRVLARDLWRTEVCLRRKKIRACCLQRTHAPLISVELSQMKNNTLIGIYRNQIRSDKLSVRSDNEKPRSKWICLAMIPRDDWICNFFDGITDTWSKLEWLQEAAKPARVTCITSVISQKIFLLPHLVPYCYPAEHRAPVGPNFMSSPLSFPDNAITDRKPPKLDYPLYRAPPSLRRRRWEEAEARA